MWFHSKQSLMSWQVGLNYTEKGKGPFHFLPLPERSQQRLAEDTAKTPAAQRHKPDSAWSNSNMQSLVQKEKQLSFWLQCQIKCMSDVRPPAAPHKKISDLLPMRSSHVSEGILLGVIELFVSVSTGQWRCLLQLRPATCWVSFQLLQTLLSSLLLSVKKWKKDLETANHASQLQASHPLPQNRIRVLHAGCFSLCFLRFSPLFICSQSLRSCMCVCLPWC